MAIWTSYRAVLTAAALVLAMLGAGCSSERPSTEAANHGEQSFFEKFSSLEAVEMPSDIWRRAAVTVRRQVADELDERTAMFADTRLGGLWVILGLRHACLVDRHGALTCSKRSSAEDDGMALGTILPSKDLATARYAVQAVVPDSIRALRLRIDNREGLARIKRNTMARVADRPIVILGPVSQATPSQRRLGT